MGGLQIDKGLQSNPFLYSQGEFQTSIHTVTYFSAQEAQKVVQRQPVTQPVVQNLIAKTVYHSVIFQQTIKKTMW